MLDKKVVVERRKNRSEKYQYVLLETSHSHDMLDHFSNDDSIYSKLNPFYGKYDERVMELKDQLFERLWKLVDKLTERQKKVIYLYVKEQMTQMEIAKVLNVNQSSVTKSLNGNVDYRKGKRSYGGSKKKIFKFAEDDMELQKIFRKMRRLEEERW